MDILHHSRIDTKKLLFRTKVRQTVRFLNKEGEKPLLTKEIFDSVLKAIPSTALEVVPFSIADGTLKVFLTRRSKDDEFWPNQWHCPGTVIINSDLEDGGDLNKPWKRLKEKELNCTSLPDPVWVGKRHLKTKRGNEIALINYVEVPMDLEGGKFFEVDNLPDDLIDHHRIIISEAVKAYKNKK